MEGHASDELVFHGRAEDHHAADLSTVQFQVKSFLVLGADSG
jgi:hypothetical protein